MTEKSALNETVKLEAAQWLGRQRSNLRTEQDAREFQAWLARDPAHREAFEALTNIWDLAGSYPHDLRIRPALAKASTSRRAVMAGILTMPIVGGVAYMAMMRPVAASSYVTAVGEQRKISLPDDSRALLDTNSRMDVMFDRGTRIVTLRYGRANFAVVTDKGRPFVVNAAESRIVSEASNFDVRCEGGRACVMLFSGQASVALNNRTHRLSAGDRMMLRGANAGMIDRPRPSSVGAWHSGRTVFEGARLVEAVAEMNRYSTIALEIRGPDLADRRISGVYRNGDSIDFANTVAVLTGAKVNEAPGRVLLVASDGQPLKKQ